MAKTHTLKAEDRKRTGTGMLKRMRREGFIPSVVYGGGSENRNVKISAKDFRDMIGASASANVLVDLELDGGGQQLAFVKDLQHDPLSGNILHADFLAINEATEITAQIPVVLNGEALGVKMGGQLEQLLYTIEIKCLPKDLPETIEGDVSDLDVGDALHIGGMQWTEGVSPTLGADVVVALAAKTRIALSDEAADEGALGEGEEGEESGEGAEEGGDTSEERSE
ncbi:MAG: 50S ribosomal protein L25 [Roseibacillus sp.]|jgi:large subunit ribosomal protein L25|nr:50S ribosomal protein L25 [Roseibacillus sp.]MBP36422.1 50S ribosomal protein L25 [Roseibacillus sp.]MDP7107483.1 50S ribosomal protein L25 [Roseibacillus sp.]HJM65507.1 50S ribosomal protein L25 [Roseibacillus sp.]